MSLGGVMPDAACKILRGKSPEDKGVSGRIDVKVPVWWVELMK